VLGCGLLLAGCSGGTSVAWPALTTTPPPPTTIVRADDVVLSSTTSIVVVASDPFCELLADVDGTLLYKDMDDVEVLRVLRFAAEFFAAAAQEAPPEIQADVQAVAHNREVPANAFESGLIERFSLEGESFRFPGVETGAREPMAEYVEVHCPGIPALGRLWAQPSSQ